MIPYGRQDIRPEDISAVIEVLQSDFLTQGPAVPRFEAAVAKKVNAKFGVAMSNATCALHLACKALDLGPGDTLWTSPVTFVASANCALYCGANIDFVDIDSRTFNMCPDSLARKLELSRRNGCLPKVVVPVHMCGQSCDMARIAELADQYGFRVIEDASHTIGGSFQAEPVGSCRYSDITVFSFHPVKIITTGEGGMAMTNDGNLAGRLSSLRSHGITRDVSRMEKSPHGSWYYEQIDLGYNFRMTDLQAALGLSQLDRLEQYVSRRHELAERYDAALTGSSVQIPWRSKDSRSAFHLYVIRLSGAIAGERRRIVEELRNAGVSTNVHYIPVHTHPYYARLGFQSGDFPLAEQYYKEALTLPLYPQMTESQQEHVIDRLLKAVR